MLQNCFHGNNIYFHLILLCSRLGDALCTGQEILSIGSEMMTINYFQLIITSSMCFDKHSIAYACLNK